MTVDCDEVVVTGGVGEGRLLIASEKLLVLPLSFPEIFILEGGDGVGFATPGFVAWVIRLGTGAGAAAATGGAAVVVADLVIDKGFEDAGTELGVVWGPFALETGEACCTLELEPAGEGLVTVTEGELTGFEEIDEVVVGCLVELEGIEEVVMD